MLLVGVTRYLDCSGDPWLCVHIGIEECKAPIVIATRELQTETGIDPEALLWYVRGMNMG